MVTERYNINYTNKINVFSACEYYQHLLLFCQMLVAVGCLLETVDCELVWERHNYANKINVFNPFVYYHQFITFPSNA